MLSVGPGASRFSPPQNIRVILLTPTLSVMYITDNIPRLAHNQGSQAGLAAVASLLDPDLTVQFANRSFDDTFAVTQRIPLAIRRAWNETQSKTPVRSKCFSRK